MYKQNIIIALDYDNENKIYQFCDQIDPSSCKIKIGKQVFTKFGPNIINNLQEKKFELLSKPHRNRPSADKIYNE